MRVIFLSRLFLILSERFLEISLSVRVSSCHRLRVISFFSSTVFGSCIIIYIVIINIIF